MAHPLTIPTLAVLAVAGSATGVYLGKAAVSEINPIYYSERPDTFHGDLVPYRPQAASEAAVYRAGQLTAAELDQALGTGCVGCRAYPEEYFPEQDPAVEPALSGEWERAGAPGLELAVYEPAEDKEAQAADFATVERYAAYPVAAAAQEAPADEVELASAVEPSTAE